MPSPTEAKTRQELIDPALKKAGWDVANPDQVGLEISVDGFDPQAWKQLEARLKRLKERGATYSLDLPKGISDYALYRPNGEIIAIVEAKRTSTAPRLAQAQAEFYVARTVNDKKLCFMIRYLMDGFMLKITKILPGME